MRENDKPLNGLVLNGKFYEAVDLTAEEVDAITESGHGLCNESCDFQDYCMGFTKDRCRLVCDKIPFPHTECYTVFRFSQSVTDKINKK